MSATALGPLWPAYLTCSGCGRAIPCRHCNVATLTVSELTAQIATDAIHDARACVGRGQPESFGGGPLWLHASRTGRWQIHSTSLILTIDASVPLTASTTVSEDTLAAALAASFIKKFGAAATPVSASGAPEKKWPIGPDSVCGYDTCRSAEDCTGFCTEAGARDRALAKRATAAANALAERIAGTLGAYGVRLPPMAMTDLIEMYCAPADPAPELRAFYAGQRDERAKTAALALDAPRKRCWYCDELLLEGPGEAPYCSRCIVVLARDAAAHPHIAHIAQTG